MKQAYNLANCGSSTVPPKRDGAFEGAAASAYVLEEPTILAGLSEGCTQPALGRVPRTLRRIVSGSCTPRTPSLLLAFTLIANAPVGKPVGYKGWCFSRYLFVLFLHDKRTAISRRASLPILRQVAPSSEILTQGRHRCFSAMAFRHRNRHVAWFARQLESAASHWYHRVSSPWRFGAD